MSPTTTTRIHPRALVRASGGPRYAVALAVDALGTGLLRPFLPLYGVTVLRLSAPATGIAMTVGAVAGLVCMPVVGRCYEVLPPAATAEKKQGTRFSGCRGLTTFPGAGRW